MQTHNSSDGSFLVSARQIMAGCRIGVKVYSCRPDQSDMFASSLETMELCPTTLLTPRRSSICMCQGNYFHAVFLYCEHVVCLGLAADDALLVVDHIDCSAVYRELATAQTGRAQASGR